MDCGGMNVHGCFMESFRAFTGAIKTVAAST
jgi:hypothetical protein